MNILRKIFGIGKKEEPAKPRIQTEVKEALNPIELPAMEESKEEIPAVMESDEVETSPERESPKEIELEIITEDTSTPTLKEAIMEKYPGNAKRLIQLFESANQCEATWDNITKARLQRFVDYMGENLAPNSVNQYGKKFKAVLNLYSDEVRLPKGFAKFVWYVKGRG